MKTGIQLIAAERRRQVSKEGWTPEHDDKHNVGQMAKAAACYAMPTDVRETEVDNRSYRWIIWPWTEKWWKPTPKDRVRELVKAGALIAAEIDRLQREDHRANNCMCTGNNSWGCRFHGHPSTHGKPFPID